jgi:hypothetical protein
MGDVERDIGSLEARMVNVEGELHAIRADVREIRDALVGMRYGWLFLTGALTLASALGAVASRIAGQVFQNIN